MSKIFDPQIVNPILTGFIEELITVKGNLTATKPFEIATKPIDEYEDRMLIKSVDKFDVSTYVAASGFYLNQGDMQAHRARGSVIVYINTEMADKIFKAAGLQVPYDEDDESMMALTGKLCQLIADALKDRLADNGYVSLLVSLLSFIKILFLKGLNSVKTRTKSRKFPFIS